MTRSSDALAAPVPERRRMAIIELTLSHLRVLRLRRGARREPSREELLIRRRATVEREQRELAWLVRSELLR